jgi:hypothetical protein
MAFIWANGSRRPPADRRCAAPAIVAEGITINRTMLAELHGLVGTG